MLRVDPIGQYPNPTSKDFITKWMIDARLLVSKWLNSRSLNHEECHIWAIGSGQSFQGMKDVRPCLGGDWEGWAASCVVFICCNGGEDGHFCGIIIPSLHRAHTQTPYRITFQIENICIMTDISHRKLEDPSFIPNRCIYLLSRLMTSALLFLKQSLSNWFSRTFNTRGPAQLFTTWNEPRN